MSSSRPPTPEPRPDLRASLTADPRPTVLTGGQTGVDTAAAIVALRTGLAVHIVFPRGFRQEDGPLTKARRRALSGATLHELPSPDVRYRTWTCVQLADAVVLLDPAGGEGCQETISAASHLAQPLLNAAAGPDFFERDSNASRLAPSSELGTWLTAHRPHVLMIAGCRASLLRNHRPDLDLTSPLEAIIAEFAKRSAGSTWPRHAD